MSTARGWPSFIDIHTVVFDFDGVFTNNKVYLDQSGIESVRCDRSDGLGIGMLRARATQLGISPNLFILSKEPNPVVIARARKLKLDCQHGVDDKLAWMSDHLKSRFPGEDGWRGVAYLGNDLNDLPIMTRAGFSVAPVDAHPRVLSRADARLPQPGGDGFIRAFVEHLIELDKFSDEEIHELICNC